MKKTSQFEMESCSLEKHAIANLSKPDMMHVQGGQAAVTTSFGKCSGFLCCDKTQSIEICNRNHY